MIAKVIAAGRDRHEALARLHRALSQMTVVVRGGTTNRSFLLDLLDRPEVRAGDIDTSWLDRLTAADEHLPTRHADVALVAAALDAFELQAAAERAAFLGWASRGRPQADATIGRTVELRHGGRVLRGRGPPAGAGPLRASSSTASAPSWRASSGSAASGRGSPIGDDTFAVVSSDQGTEHLVEVDGVAHRFSRDDAGIVRAPAAALVVGVDVEPGDVVAAGDRLGVVEAMKMEIGVPAPVGGRVRDVFVARNVQVAAGTALFRIEPAGRRRATSSTGAAHRARPPRPPPRPLRPTCCGRSCSASTSTRRRLARGAWRPAVADAGSCSTSSPTSPPSRRSAATRRPTTTSGRRASTSASYLRSLDLEREGLPTWFGDALTAGRRPLRRHDARARPGAGGGPAADLRVPAAARRAGAGRARRCSTPSPRTPATPRRPRAPRGARPPDRARPAGATRRSPPRRAPCATACSTGRTSSGRAARPRRAMRELVAGARRPGRRRGARVDELVACPLPLDADPRRRRPLRARRRRPARLIEVLLRRYYKIRELAPVVHGDDGVVRDVVRAPRARRPRARRSASTGDDLDAALAAIAGRRRRRWPRPTRSSSTSSWPGRPTRRPTPTRCRRALGGRARRRPSCPSSCAGSRWSPRTPRRHRRAHVPPARRDGRAAVLDGRRRATADAGRPDALRGGRHVPRPPPDDRPPAADVAAGELRDRPPAGRLGRRRRQPVRLPRPGQPVRRAADRRRRGPRPHADPRRVRAAPSPCPRSRACSSAASTPSAAPATSGRRCAAWSGTG